MSKKTYICPECHIQVKDLKGHTARMHKGKSELKEGRSPSKGKTLELKTPPKKEKTESAQVYHCVDCGYEPITKGQATCPGCGVHLDWSKL